MQKTLSKEISKIIRAYVRRNFGENEVKEPSWAIEPLACEIAEQLIKEKKCQVLQ